MDPTLFEIIYEDEDLLAINKPAGLVCHPTKGDGYSSLIGRIRIHLGPGAEAHMVNRLDRETSGVVLVAKCLERAREIRAAFETRTVEKRYLAICIGWMDPPQRIIDAPLGKDLKSLVAIKNCVRADGAPAMTQVSVVQHIDIDRAKYSVLEILPLTGRKHQIRIHLSYVGHPLVGDKLYGSNENYYLDFVTGKLQEQDRRALITPHHALHCSSITLPYQGGMRTFAARPEAWMLQFCGKDTGFCPELTTKA